MIDYLPRCRSANPSRLETQESHFEAVTRVIDEMRSDLNRTLSIRQMSRIAYISPYHFIRVFHYVTGVSPWKFHWMLKLHAAKNMLLSTRQSIIDISMEVGYKSHGTFARRFSELVGLPPNRFRRLSCTMDARELEFYSQTRRISQQPRSALSGKVNVPADFKGSVVVACFPTSLPQGRPLQFSWANQDYYFSVPQPAAHEYFVHAFALPSSGSIRSWLTDERILRNRDRCFLAGQSQADSEDRFLEVCLRSKEITDPPILLALGTLALNPFLDADCEPEYRYDPFHAQTGIFKPQSANSLPAVA